MLNAVCAIADGYWDRSHAAAWSQHGAAAWAACPNPSDLLDLVHFVGGSRAARHALVACFETTASFVPVSVLARARAWRDGAPLEIPRPKPGRRNRRQRGTPCQIAWEAIAYADVTRYDLSLIAEAHGQLRRSPLIGRRRGHRAMRTLLKRFYVAYRALADVVRAHAVCPSADELDAAAARHAIR
ncbi:MAG TPA: hypothetical protein VHH11_13880 [Gammaproteobacteria bacterium]|nr:hypothetical protein [Gammaproteobacteria bacterium]